MIWVLFAITLNILFAIAAAAIWTNHFASWKVRSQKREVGYLRDEIQIDPTRVPQFKPTWRNARYGTDPLAG
jgi:hypothetical protein